MGAWKNQYIDLIGTKPHLIIEETEIEEGALCPILPKFERCFVELGSGSGGHLIELANRNPEVLCVGFELRYKRAFRTAEKAEQLGLKNLLVYRANANLLSSLFPENSLDRVYVNYPDPWAKKRWQKHRLLNDDSVALLTTLLKPGGALRYKTDHKEYFDTVVKSLRQNQTFQIVKETHDMFGSCDLSDNITTEFEQLFLSQGLPISFVEAIVR